MSDQTPNNYSSDQTPWSGQPQPGNFGPSGPYSQPPYSTSYENIPMQPSYPPPPPGVYPSVPTSQPDQGYGAAMASLVLGITGMIAWLLPIAGLPVSILGIIFALRGRHSTLRRAMATTGLVLSIIALSLTVCNAAAGVYLSLPH